LGELAISANLRRQAIRIAEAGTEAADPELSIQRLLRIEDGFLIAGDYRYDLGKFSAITVVGAGKASARMAVAVEHILGLRIQSGLVVVKDGHREPTHRVEIVECAHPIPDGRGAAAARRILAILEKAGDEELIIAVISGGGSALLSAPAEGLSVVDVAGTTELLLRAGADIRQSNMVRKHISLVHGGNLASAASPATVLVLVVSDVLENPLDVIASGPFAPDPSTYADALCVLGDFGLLSAVEPSIVARLQLGSRGGIDETPDARNPIFHKVDHLIVADLSVAMSAVLRQAKQEGFNVLTGSQSITGEASKFGRLLGSIGRGLPRDPPTASIFGGETTVSVRGGGLGGRCQEIALAAAIEISGAEGIGVMAIGTDGTDGPTDAAGGLVDGGTLDRARAVRLDPEAMLNDNDSYSLLRATGDLLVTGPTGTNVNDIMIAFSEGAEETN
jgi:hydroxypyruvate reductase